MYATSTNPFAARIRCFASRMSAPGAPRSALAAVAALAAVWLLAGQPASAAPIQGDLLVWLRADAGVTTSGSEVTTWADQATAVGGANNAVRVTAGAGPAVATGVGGMPTIRFDGVNDYLDIAGHSAFNTDTFTWFMVARSAVVPPSATQLMMRSQYTGGSSSGADVMWATFITNAPNYTSHARNSAGGFIGSSAAATADPTLISARWGADDTVIQWLNGTASPTNTGATASPTGHVRTRIGANTGSSPSLFYDGDISEILIYNTTLNNAQRVLTENYLAAKYSGSVGPNQLPIASDRYAGKDAAKGNYDFDVFGIGREADGAVLSASSGNGLTLAELNGSLDVGEYVLAGNQAGSNSWLTGGGLTRWERVWYLDKTATDGVDITITFDFDDAGVAMPELGVMEQFVLLHSTTGPESLSVLDVSAVISGNTVSFALSNALLSDGYYTLGTLLVPEPSTVTLLGLAALVVMGNRRRKRS